MTGFTTVFIFISVFSSTFCALTGKSCNLTEILKLV